jgi:hypothetical protein
MESETDLPPSPDRYIPGASYRVYARVREGFDGNFTDMPTDFLVPRPGVGRVPPKVFELLGRRLAGGEIGWVAVPPPGWRV